jgi:signal transduction histidine kinase
LAELTAAEFGDLIADRIRSERVAISERWLERLVDLLQVRPNDVFPTEHLLDHIPALVVEIAAYIQDPQSEAVAANTAIISKARELGAMRHAQQASVHQLLAEYRLLGGILFTFVQEELARFDASPSASDVIEVIRRLNDALWILMQTTVDTFVAEYTTTIASNAARLESFNRMVSHELRQPLGTLLYAVPLLKAAIDDGSKAPQQHFADVMDRNIAKLTELTEQLAVLSRLQSRRPDTPDVQETELATVAWEVARQLREMADSRGVEIAVDEGLPKLVVDVARLELILVNLVSNAVKYCDPAKPHRFVRVESTPSDDPTCAIVAVRDNGLGVAEADLDRIFDRFVRLHATRDNELGVRGSGLGLAIAAECAQAIGGSIRVESTLGGGTTFYVAVPVTPADSQPTGAST